MHGLRSHREGIQQRIIIGRFEMHAIAGCALMTIVTVQGVLTDSIHVDLLMDVLDR